MDLREYLLAARRYWVAVVICAILGALLAAAYSLVQTSSAVATADVQISFEAQGTLTVIEMLQRDTVMEQAGVRFVPLATSDAVVASAVKELPITMDSAELINRLEVVAVPESALIRVSATHSDPQIAAAISNAIATNLIELVEQNQNASAVTDPIRLSLVTKAVPETNGSGNSRGIFVVLFGLLFGAAIGFGVAVARYLWDDKIRSVRDIESQVDAPILGVLPYDHEIATSPSSPTTDLVGTFVESLRSVRTSVQYRLSQSNAHTIGVTGTTAGVGASVFALHLGISLSETGMRVLLVDGDLRDPTIAPLADLGNEMGLSDYLESATREGTLPTFRDSNLAIMPSGHTPKEPGAVLSTTKFAEVMSELASTYDVVIVDLPPLRDSADAGIVSRVLDSMILVSAHGVTSTLMLKGAATTITRAGGRILGHVLSKLPRKSTDLSFIATSRQSRRPVPVRVQSEAD